MTRGAALLLAAAAGLAAAAPPDKAALEERRKDAIARCEAQRGVDCRTEEGLRVWLLQERSRAEAVKDGSISIRRRVDRLAPEQK